MWQLHLSKHINPLLKVCKDKTTIIKLHALMIITGILHKKSFGGQLIASYARIGDIASARKMFDVLRQKGVDAWNAMIIAYSRKESPSEVLSLYHRMVCDGVRPDSSTFTIAIKACTSLCDWAMGEKIKCRAVECGYEDDVFVGSSLVNLYAKCGKMDEAMVVFEKMPRKDIVCWTTMITGFSQSGKPREAVDMYRGMRREGMEGDDVVMLGLIQACASLGELRLGLSIHGYMMRRELPMNVIVRTSLVDMYAKVGHLDVASCVFGEMPHKNVVSWGALISGYAQNGFAGKALELLVEMQNVGFKPDTVSLVSALLACSQVGCLKLGKSIHGYIIRRFNFDQISGTAIIDMYSKCGALASARHLFDRVDSKDLISWNAMITSYGVHGLGKEALSLFLEMTKTNVIPNDATFASLLSALSHSGLVDEGKYWFDTMTSKYKIHPKEKHYACLVDLLARAGRVKEACELMKSVTTELGLPIWVALLSGCCNHGNLLIGEMASKKVLQLNPDDLGIYSLVSNFFAMARKWDEVAGVRKMMKSTGMKKVPGYSSVEVNGELHTFLMEDKCHRYYADIFHLLDLLEYEMKALGYAPKIGLILDREEAKEQMVCITV